MIISEKPIQKVSQVNQSSSMPMPGPITIVANVLTWRILQKRIKKYNSKKFGEKNHRWKGGRLKRDGYILVKKRDHPFSDKRGYMREQRFVWEEENKAMLLPWADVHHINGIKDDNRIENLQAMMHREHTRLECLRLKPWRFRMKQKPMTLRNDRDTSRDRDTLL